MRYMRLQRWSCCTQQNDLYMCGDETRYAQSIVATKHLGRAHAGLLYTLSTYMPEHIVMRRRWAVSDISNAHTRASNLVNG